MKKKFTKSTSLSLKARDLGNQRVGHSQGQPCMCKHGHRIESHLVDLTDMVPPASGMRLRTDFRGFRARRFPSVRPKLSEGDMILCAEQLWLRL
jgi:hypothetical protein